MKLYREQLDHAECQHPDCTHENHSTFVISAECHPEAGCFVFYERASGELVLCCNECRGEICKVGVASEFDMPLE